MVIATEVVVGVRVASGGITVSVEVLGCVEVPLSSSLVEVVDSSGITTDVAAGGVYVVIVCPVLIVP